MKKEYPKHIKYSKKKQKDLYEYKCEWCSTKFLRWVGKHLSHNEVKETAKHSNISDQVKCPKCKNFIKTWPEDG